MLCDLEYASSSDSDAEAPVVDQAWRGEADSDAESIDSEQEDPLKYADIFNLIFCLTVQWTGTAILATFFYKISQHIQPQYVYLG